MLGGRAAATAAGDVLEPDVAADVKACTLHSVSAARNGAMAVTGRGYDAENSSSES